MDRRTRERLLQLNRDFYEEHARSFDSTRVQPWPGWQRVLAGLPASARSLLDAGCGNGRFGLCLAEAGREDVDYTGVDASRALVEAGRERARRAGAASLRFLHCDLFEDDELPKGPFDAIVLFGVLHHVPGFDERVELVARLASRLAPAGFLAATLWRFGQDPRAAGRTLAWEKHPLAIDSAQLEPGDALLLWGDGGDGGDRDDVVRYCHFVDDDEVERLIARTRETGLDLTQHFRSDGKTGDSNEYLIWSRRNA